MSHSLSYSSTLFHSHKNREQDQFYQESIEDHIQNKNLEIIEMEQEYNDFRYGRESPAKYKASNHEKSQKNQSNTISITQRDIINLLDKCPQLMREDKLLLRNRVKNYFKDLAQLRNEDRFAYEGAIESDNDISELIEILAQCKKPLTKIHLYEKHMHWLQVKLRKYVTLLHKKKKEECLEQFKKTKRLTTNHNQCTNRATSPIFPSSTKRSKQNATSSGFYKRFKQNTTEFSKRQGKINTLSNISQEKSRKNTEKSQQLRMYDSTGRFKKNQHENTNFSLKSSNQRGKKLERCFQRPLSRNQKYEGQNNQYSMYPKTCQNKSTKDSMFRKPTSVSSNKAKPPLQQKSKNFMNKEQHKKQVNSKNIYNDIDNLSQINRKSSILDHDNQQQNHGSIFGTSDRIRKLNEENETYKKQNTCMPKNLQNKQVQPHICSLIQKQVCQVSQWSKKLSEANSPVLKNYLQQNNKNFGQYDLASKIQSIKMTNNKIDNLIANSHQFTSSLENKQSSKEYNDYNKLPSYKKTQEQQNLFTSPQILAQCRMFINYHHQPQQQSNFKNFFQAPENPQQEQQKNFEEVESPKFSPIEKNLKEEEIILLNNDKIVFNDFRSVLAQIFKEGYTISMQQQFLDGILNKCSKQVQISLEKVIGQTNNFSQLKFEKFVPLLIQECKEKIIQFYSKNIFQLLDLDNKRYIDSQDFEVFIQNLRVSQVQESLVDDIQTIFTKIKSKLFKAKQTHQKIQVYNFYHLQLIDKKLITDLCQILEPFEFQINITEE